MPTNSLNVSRSYPANMKKSVSVEEIQWFGVRESLHSLSATG